MKLYGKKGQGQNLPMARAANIEKVLKFECL